MAGDWIKMRGCLSTNPKVLRIAAIIEESVEIGKRLSTGFNGALSEIVTRDVTRDITLASLLRVWCAANEHTEDGVWHGIAPEDFDHIAGLPGFGAAMEEVGWAIYDEAANTTTLPNFLEHNVPAKRGRSSGAERQRRYREKNKAKSNAKGDGNGDVTRDVTALHREEKRREDKTTLRVVGAFGRFWKAWPSSARKVAKAACLKSWERQKLDSLADRIVASVEALKITEQWQRGYEPAPLTFLNQRRWEDNSGPLPDGGNWREDPRFANVQ